MSDVTVLTPGRIDGFDTRNRMFMAPMTRSRALPGGVPSELAIEYYAQRASAGLITTPIMSQSLATLKVWDTLVVPAELRVRSWT